MEKSLTIIVPVYNEEENIERIASALKNYQDSTDYLVKILFVNDGSSDESQTLIDKFCQEYPDFHYIEFAQNRGLSAAIMAGFDHVETSLAGYIDADLQTDPRDFDLLLEHIDDFDLVTGVRTGRKESFVKNMSSTIANKIRRAFTHDGMDDTGCPLKIIRSEVAKRIPMFNGLHRFLPAMVLLQNGKIKQVPVRHYPRIAGQAKFGLLNRLWGPLQDCFAYLWMKKKYINYTVKKRG
ncbi:glycosyltransferase family 2 protein [Natronoflexus pectinivorans]|uniref:Glycosyl transferase family 2 n=1 Tax=Natronoflexus pectinivorans TaxID=682526 RepID=A0A4R2GDA0_9BACT|nr:glycosyltransferase family 2 protein [Natronoflexus pectinivorans]TCO06068.1 glycosyl transferase family 2 [Natronoflexus pectinivorans]